MIQRYVSAFLLGAAVTLSLFWLMQFMILHSRSKLDLSDNLKMVEFVRLKREDQVVNRKRRLPEKPPPKKKPPPPRMNSAKANPSKTPMPPIDMPNLDVPMANPRMDGSLVGGLQMGGYSGEISTDVIPIFRAALKYPRQALKRKIEGWVRVEFTIDEQGNVVNPVVVESFPSSIFDRSAIRTISKWKFKPKLVGGIPVEQRALQVLEYKMTKK